MLALLNAVFCNHFIKAQNIIGCLEPAESGMLELKPISLNMCLVRGLVFQWFIKSSGLFCAALQFAAWRFFMTVSNSNAKPVFSTASMTGTALMTAAICVIGPLSIPLAGGVPISLQDFIIGLAAVLLGMKRGTMAMFLYLLLGLAGLPVFSGFTGGIGKLAGPTGGYLVGFLLLALIVGKASDLTDSWLKIALALVLGQIADMAIGTAWLMWMAHMDLKTALFAGVIPFLPGNAVKTIAVVLIGKTVKPLLGKVLDQ